MNKTNDKSYLPATVSDIECLEELLSRPTPTLERELAALEGDILILGVGGKIGPSLSRMAKRACPEKTIYAVARFSDIKLKNQLEEDGIIAIKADLLDNSAIQKLPDVANVIFMAGQKFGSSGTQSLTWAMNSFMPGLVAERFHNSRIVVFSTGCVYPFVPVNSGGATEDLLPDPPGEYAMSCIGRERIFEHFSRQHDTPGRLFRLNYAIDLRYGVLVDIARKILDGQSIDLTMGHVNVIWQGDANVMALRCLAHATTPTSPINITGPETISVRWVAKELAKSLNKDVSFTGEEAERAWLTNTAHANQLFGYPQVPLKLLIDWVADWVRNGREMYDKPTKFEVRDGKY